MVARVGRLYTEVEAAERLTISKALLRKWRASGDGPEFVRFGSRVRYPEYALEAWIIEGTTRHGTV